MQRRTACGGSWQQVIHRGAHHHAYRMAWLGLACPNPGPQGAWGGKRGGKRGRDAGSGGEEEEAGRKPENVYLILKGGRQKSAEYRWALVGGVVTLGCATDGMRRLVLGVAGVQRIWCLPASLLNHCMIFDCCAHRKDDLWVISNNPEFRSGYAPGQVGDRSRAPWVRMAGLWLVCQVDGCLFRLPCHFSSCSEFLHTLHSHTLMQCCWCDVCCAGGGGALAVARPQPGWQVSAQATRWGAV